jgi:hypothetical protein
VINIGAYDGKAEAGKSYFGESVCGTIVAGDIVLGLLNGTEKVRFYKKFKFFCHLIVYNGVYRGG